MRILGVYFGPQVINVADIANSRLLSNIQISYSIFSQGDTVEDRVPEEVKIVATLKDELIKHGIKTKDVVLALSGKDLIVRNFEMPILPLQELSGAVNFEVSKYIPFKTQDLISDFQSIADRSIQKLHVLFAAIKKETLDKYISIVGQLGLRLHAVEYSAFSILRLLKLSQVREKGIIGVLAVDVTKNDEVNLMVLENGFPLFSRDITLISGSSGYLKDEEMVMDKLKREIRVSLDYYRNKLPFKKIEKVFLIMEQNYQPEIESLLKDRELPVQFIHIDKYIKSDKLLLSPLAFIKSYSAGLSSFKIALKINLLSAKEKTTQKASLKKSTKPSIFEHIKLDPRIALLAIAICFAVYFTGLNRIVKPLQNELNNITASQPAIANVPSGASYDELVSINADYNKKIETINAILNKRVYLTELIDAIPRLTLDNMYLTNIKFIKKESEMNFVIAGNIYLGDSNKEVEAVNTFLYRLKESAVFKKYFSLITIGSIDQAQEAGKTVTTFLISCEGEKG